MSGATPQKFVVGWQGENTPHYHDHQRRALVAELEKGIHPGLVPPGICLSHLSFPLSEERPSPSQTAPIPLVLPWGAMVGVQGRTGVIKTALSAAAVAYALLNGHWVTYVGVDTSSAVRFAYRVANMVPVAAAFSPHLPAPLRLQFPWEQIVAAYDDPHSEEFRHLRATALRLVVSPAAISGQLMISTPSTRRPRTDTDPPPEIKVEDLWHLVRYRRQFADHASESQNRPRHLVVPDFAQQLSTFRTGLSQLERYEAVANTLKILLAEGSDEDGDNDTCVLLPMQSNRTEGIDDNARTRGSDDWGQICDLLYLGVRGYVGGETPTGRQRQNGPTERTEFVALVISKDRDGIYADCRPEMMDNKKGLSIGYHGGGIVVAGRTETMARTGESPNPLSAPLRGDRSEGDIRAPSVPRSHAVSQMSVTVDNVAAESPPEKFGNSVYIPGSSTPRQS